MEGVERDSKKEDTIFHRETKHGDDSYRRIHDVRGEGNWRVGSSGTAVPRVPSRKALETCLGVQHRPSWRSSSSSPNTSRPMASGVLSQLYHQGVEVDALVRVEVRALRHSKSFVRRRTRYL